MDEAVVAFSRNRIMQSDPEPPVMVVAAKDRFSALADGRWKPLVDCQCPLSGATAMATALNVG